MKTGINGVEAEIGGSLAQWLFQEGFRIDTSKIQADTKVDPQLNKNWKPAKFTLGAQLNYGTTTFSPSVTIDANGKVTGVKFSLLRKF